MLRGPRRTPQHSRPPSLGARLSHLRGWFHPVSWAGAAAPGEKADTGSPAVWSWNTSAWRGAGIPYRLTLAAESAFCRGLRPTPKASGGVSTVVHAPLASLEGVEKVSHCVITGTPARS
jgi:hypothetical protein